MRVKGIFSFYFFLLFFFFYACATVAGRLPNKSGGPPARLPMSGTWSLANRGNVWPEIKRTGSPGGGVGESVVVGGWSGGGGRMRDNLCVGEAYWAQKESPCFVCGRFSKVKCRQVC